MARKPRPQPKHKPKPKRRPSRKLGVGKVVTYRVRGKPDDPHIEGGW